LETLLAHGGDFSPPAVAPAGRSLEEWLGAEFGGSGQLAAASLRGEGMDPGEAVWLRADPVHLRADRDRVLLADATSFEIDEKEATALIAALNGHFADDGLEFVAPVPQRWYVRAPGAARVETTPTPGVRGGGIEGHLPRGEDGPRWRRIGNEAQMLLHNHPCNEAREARGALPVNSVWFWGAGRRAATPPNTAYESVWTSEPLAIGLAAGAGLPVHPLPAAAGRWLELAGKRPPAPQLVVLHGPRNALGSGVGSWRRALEELEALWIAPLLGAVRRGVLRSLALDAPGLERYCVARITRLSLLRFWRRRRPLGDYVS
jgi:hypothetical protein